MQKNSGSILLKSIGDALYGTATFGTQMILKITTLALILLLAVMAQNAFAWNTFHQHKLTYGVGNYGNSTQRYWIDTSASEFTTAINNAMNDWKNTTSFWGITTPIWYTVTTTKSSSRMDIYQDGSGQTVWWGRTRQYNGTTVIDPDVTNWVWGRIDVSSDYSNYPGLRKQTIAHEMGHVMGLAHTSMQVLMNTVIVNLTTINRAQPNDLDGINYLY